mmetsp:Transcript_37842/g.116931  ORF Transcript_37842/g.116931 Transcript_37842/m.116931 type:complete len:239 (-) Transcript_37842:832-1548(-)
MRWGRRCHGLSYAWRSAPVRYAFQLKAVPVYSDSESSLWLRKLFHEMDGTLWSYILSSGRFAGDQPCVIRAIMWPNGSRPSTNSRICALTPGERPSSNWIMRLSSLSISSTHKTTSSPKLERVSCVMDAWSRWCVDAIHGFLYSNLLTLPSLRAGAPPQISPSLMCVSASRTEPGSTWLNALPVTPFMMVVPWPMRLNVPRQHASMWQLGSIMVFMPILTTPSDTSNVWYGLNCSWRW